MPLLHPVPRRPERRSESPGATDLLSCIDGRGQIPSRQIHRHPRRHRRRAACAALPGGGLRAGGVGRLFGRDDFPQCLLLRAGKNFRPGVQALRGAGDGLRRQYHGAFVPAFRRPHLDDGHQERHCRIPQNQRLLARCGYRGFDGPAHRRHPPPMGSRARTLEAHCRSERPQRLGGGRERVDGGDLPEYHRRPGLAQQRTKRADRIQLFGGEGTGTALHASDFPEPVVGRAEREPDAPACGQEPVFPERRYY